jgi:fumarate hydratase, class II
MMRRSDLPPAKEIFQLNVFKRVILYNAMQSLQLLGDAIHTFDIHCAKGLEANEDKMKEYVDRSLMLVTALSPHIGYDRAAEQRNWRLTRDWR